MSEAEGIQSYLVPANQQNFYASLKVTRGLIYNGPTALEVEIEQTLITDQRVYCVDE